MGFMDNVTSFAQGVGAKAKGNMDVVGLNAQISSITREINNLYKNLGEKYYELCKENPNEELKEMVTGITERLEKIKELQGNIESTKESLSSVQLIKTQPQAGSRKCPKCGAVLDDDCVFCTKCGERLPEKTENPVSTDQADKSSETDPGTGGAVCPDCGTPLKEGYMFCTSCGRRI